MIPFKQTTLPVKVPAETMAWVYDQIKTPVKHGAVMKLEDAFTDGQKVTVYDSF